MTAPVPALERERFGALRRHSVLDTLPERDFPTLEEIERRHILAALDQTGGVIDGPRGAARILRLHPNTLRSRMERLGIKRRPRGAS